MLTEREKFMARLMEARDAGLVDQKFFFHPAKVLKPEEIFAAMNQVEDAVKVGTRHKDWQGNNPAAVIAALYVEKNGCYAGLPGVDPWDRERDARRYGGPHPVVAHPPCERWGRYWGGAPAQVPRLTQGDDGGCFAAALHAVRVFGGVLEHPEGSHAWRWFQLTTPPRGGGWVKADWLGGWTCCVEQGAYGHKARKATWLYAHSVDLPSLRWGSAPGDFVRLDEGFHSTEERARAIKTGACQRLSKNQRAATPAEFRDLLLSIARSATLFAKSA